VPELNRATLVRQLLLERHVVPTGRRSASWPGCRRWRRWAARAVASGRVRAGRGEGHPGMVRPSCASGRSSRWPHAIPAPSRRRALSCWNSRRRTPRCATSGSRRPA